MNAVTQCESSGLKSMTLTVSSPLTATVPTQTWLIGLFLLDSGVSHQE